ncbi:MAG: DUF192 domain-containing protein [Gammaproteobacteria bacterium]|nr:DUF192 domain-containing protein [Gammaproteobacteria bacterium]
MKRMLLLIVFLPAAGALAQQESDLDSNFDKTNIVIEADEHACYHFDVYVAASIRQQRRGLMYVRELPPGSGMLFVYDRPGTRSMWMKNTYIPLDMLFIRGDGTVESVVERTKPLSLTSISSGEPVVYVLELNGGTAAELGIGTRSRVHFADPEIR